VRRLQDTLSYQGSKTMPLSLWKVRAYTCPAQNDRAEEARTYADQLDDPLSNSPMLRVANDSEILAERAIARASGHWRKST
jgi:hypothetical protein